MVGRFFAAAEGPHIALAPETVYEVAGMTINNSIVFGVVSAVIVITLALWAAYRISVRPRRGISQLFELMVGFVLGLLEEKLGSRARAVKYTPIFATFFIFILLSYLFSLMPGVGPGIFARHDGEQIALFRAFTADLNGTLALAVIGIITVQVLSIREQGLKGHLQHYFSDKPWNPINFFIGILEVFGELTRVLSLSLRLFLNTAVGEILISVFIFVGQNGSSLTVLPIIIFEFLIAGIQAYVFTNLLATYFALATAHHEEHISTKFKDLAHHPARPTKLAEAAT